MLVLVDGENVRRSRWPNLSKERLVELVDAWARREGVEATVVFDGSAPAGSVGSGAESADDWLVRRAAELAAGGTAFRLVTSDRELRVRAGAEQVTGGGAFLRELGASR